jgi:hypothetical protein
VMYPNPSNVSITPMVFASVVGLAFAHPLLKPRIIVVASFPIT